MDNRNYSVTIEYNAGVGEAPVSVYVRRASETVTEIHGADEKKLLKHAVEAIIADLSEAIPTL